MGGERFEVGAIGEVVRVECARFFKQVDGNARNEARTILWKATMGGRSDGNCAGWEEDVR
jgi:hypothetical protein